MPHYAAFHQGLYYLPRQNRSSEKEKQYIFFELQPVTPHYIQCTILTLLYVALWKIQLV